jgi:cytochrome b pre-mRNA-processing protein 3
LTLLSRLLGKRDKALEPLRPLWHRVVEIARDKAWYAEHGVADTVPGRFDAITLVLALVLLRMERDTALIPQSVLLTELFVDDMDGQLRQSGIGDIFVGKHIGKLMGTLGGRLGALREALPQGDAAVAEVLARNVSLIEGAKPIRVAVAARALQVALNATASEDLLTGRIVR